MAAWRWVMKRKGLSFRAWIAAGDGDRASVGPCLIRLRAYEPTTKSRFSRPVHHLMGMTNWARHFLANDVPVPGSRCHSLAACCWRATIIGSRLACLLVYVGGALDATGVAS